MASNGPGLGWVASYQMCGFDRLWGVSHRGHFDPIGPIDPLRGNCYHDPFVPVEMARLWRPKLLIQAKFAFAQRWTPDRQMRLNTSRVPTAKAEGDTPWQRYLSSS